MYRFNKHSSAFIAFTFSALMLSACGGNQSNQFLKTVDLAVNTQENSTYLTLTTTFDLGGKVTLAEMGADIPNPKTQTVAGHVQFSQLPNGLGQIAINANTNLIPDASAELGQTLPNGKPLPLALNAQPGQVLGVPIADHSRGYVGGDTQSVAFIGAALAIKDFDQVMNQLQTPINVFFMQNVGSNVLGIGGIFGSSTAFENGIAIFGRYTHPTAAKAMVEMQQQIDPSADYEIDKLNYHTMRRLQKFFSKKRSLEFY